MAAASRGETVNADLFTLTYGSIVTTLVKDYEDIGEVNRQLETMGYNIGIRLVDEFFAKSGVEKCKSFKETAERIATTAFRMFLGITGEVTKWNDELTACSIVIKDNPLTEFVELPPEASELHYSNMICGAIRGALEMVSMRVTATFEQDTLHGAPTSEIRLELKEVMEDEAGDDYKDE